MTTPFRSTLAVRAARPRRGPRRRALRRLALATLAAVPLLTVAPRAEASTPESYAQCLLLVDTFLGNCLVASDSWYEKYGCKWVAGVGVIGCAAMEALELLAKGITLPQS